MANEPGLLRVCVCHAESAAAVWQCTLALPPRATVGDAVRASGFEAQFPGRDAWALGVGVFGKSCQADTPLADGDRVEIYRPLAFDPKVSRRRRAEHRRAKAARMGRERPAGLL
ncbi:RnfH family protein [Bordetella sp. BOR01]|uniref:RnfH family protein n=1 Tax=Bordetella sp. BOR01 TaxID=2854779 RepID=UPI001C437E44|nr:RnfH family protein [Bordetella sp. BOR01]MBV7485968.1 RnfH family protein [Bordetella sp. BOR01]